MGATQVPIWTVEYSSPEPELHPHPLDGQALDVIGHCAQMRLSNCPRSDMPHHLCGPVSEGKAAEHAMRVGC